MAEPTSASKVLPKFLRALSVNESNVIMDLGPVVGANISFFGEQLACKIFVEDLFSEVEKRRSSNQLDELPAALVARLQRPPESIDGILCWDLFDYLDKAAGQALATSLVTLLRPGGALHGFFGTSPTDIKHYTRFFVESADLLRLRTVPATPVRRNVLVTRDINKMFDGLTVDESVLLKSSTREVLFRKP